MADATAQDWGELGLVDAVVARLPQGAGVLIGPGDDAAVVAAPDGRVVATTDVLVEGVHFRRDWSSGYDVGRKAAAASLADVAAMGGTGTALLVSLSAPPDLPAAWALALADGLRDEASLVGASVVGGDTARGAAVVVAVTALGDLAGRAPVTRSGAHVGDVVVVVGQLSWSALGLALLQSGGHPAVSSEAHVAPAAETGGPTDDVRRTAQLALDRHRRPEPPYAAGPALAAAGATAMCDVSDGLVSDLGHVARASGVGIELEDVRDEDDPRSLTALLAPEVIDRALLHGGEGHALVATVPADRLADAVAVGARRIGRVVAGAGVSSRSSGVELTHDGWEHFP